MPNNSNDFLTNTHIAEALERLRDREEERRNRERLRRQAERSFGTIDNRYFSESALSTEALSERYDNVVRDVPNLTDSYREYMESSLISDSINSTTSFEIPRFNEDNDSILRESSPVRPVETLGNIIMPYNYKPNYVKFGKAAMYMGIELEVYNKKERVGNNKMAHILDENEHLFFMKDGSIGNGFEIVTMPCSYEYHMKNSIGMLDVLSKNGFTSHEPGTCGLHFHVNRDYFGDSVDEQELGISKVLFMMERWFKKIKKLSRRRDEHINRWAASYADILEESDYLGKPADEIRDLLIKGAKNKFEKYRCVNIKNQHTIEFRFFRGTLVERTFKSAMQFVKIMCETAKHLSISEIASLDFQDVFYGKFEELNVVLDNLNPESTDSTITYANACSEASNTPLAESCDLTISDDNAVRWSYIDNQDTSIVPTIEPERFISNEDDLWDLF